MARPDPSAAPEVFHVFKSCSGILAEFSFQIQAKYPLICVLGKVPKRALVIFGASPLQKTSFHSVGFFQLDVEDAGNQFGDTLDFNDLHVEHASYVFCGFSIWPPIAALDCIKTGIAGRNRHRRKLLVDENSFALLDTAHCCLPIDLEAFDDGADKDCSRVLITCSVPPHCPETDCRGECIGGLVSKSGGGSAP